MHNCRGMEFPRRQYPCVIVAWPFGCACHGAHELVSHEAHELFNSCLRNPLRHLVSRGFALSTCFALPQSPAIDQAHRCRGIQVQIQSADILRFLATLWIPSPSVAVLTAAHLHTLRQWLPLMMTPAETDRRVALSPPQSASSRPPKSLLCSQRNQHFALGLPTRYLPILLTHSISASTVLPSTTFPHRCELRSGRSCDR